MYLLQGLEQVRAATKQACDHPSETPIAMNYNYPKPSYCAVIPVLYGSDLDTITLLSRHGEAEQLAYKGWVEQVYNIVWDSQHRNKLRDSLEGSEIIRPEMDAIGDFRRIRNDLIHGHGIARSRETGKCKVLKWFNPGEVILLRVGHVYDFLNQMGMLSSFPVSADDKNCCIMWKPHGDREEALRTIAPTPDLVSLRTSFVKKMENGSDFYAVIVVFENGVFMSKPIELPPDGRSNPERYEFMLKTHVDEHGNVRFANGTIMKRDTLYAEAVDVQFGKGPKHNLGGVPGPWYQFKK